MQTELLIATVAPPLLIIWLIYAGRRWYLERTAIRLRNEAAESGLTEPMSLHPVIDQTVCIGCASCAAACPEGRILGIIKGKAELVEPSHCIGHGACASACPMQAISLVFGTEKRGVDIPHVGPDFQTNVPGIYIAGELGGMGLIRNAIEQGRQAMEEIVKLGGFGRDDMTDVIIVGAGPAGFSASLAAKQHGLKSVTLEQDSFGGTVAHFPRGKLVMTAPATLPLHGKVNFRETTKEELLEFWSKVRAESGIEISFEERVESIEKLPEGFCVKTTRGSHRGRTVLLAIGRRGTPRKLGVDGEDSTKVVYRLVDPEQYRGKHVLVVGGGDSALEAATSISDEPETKVALSYRSPAFSRAKLKNRERVEQAHKSGRLDLLLQSNVIRIDKDHVELEHRGDSRKLKNDAVIVCAGGILPTKFLQSTGIDVETKHGTA
ncbi:MAG: NAD(P)-binding domain-containing protein [Paracoccaceae bacterium]